MNRLRKRIANDEELTVKAFEEQLAKEVESEDLTAEDSMDEAQELLRQANELLSSTVLPDEEKIVDSSKEDEVNEVLKACDNLQKEIAEKEMRISSETQKGIQDEIGDEAHGGDPSVSEVVKTTVDCDTDKEVFPTNSQYVARITRRLDRVASSLEAKGMKKMAFRIDQISDKLESLLK